MTERGKVEDINNNRKYQIESMSKGKLKLNRTEYGEQKINEKQIKKMQNKTIIELIKAVKYLSKEAGIKLPDKFEVEKILNKEF